MLNIIGHRVYGLGDAIVASGLPRSTATNLDFFTHADAISWYLDNSRPFQGLTPQEIDTHLARARRLSSADVGSGHDCFLKGILVNVLVEYPAHWAVQLQRYHFIDFVSSSSTMHCLIDMDIKQNLERTNCNRMVADVVCTLIEEYKKIPEDQRSLPSAKAIWKEAIETLPRGFLLTALLTTNYLQLKTIWQQRRHHKLDEWQVFCDWIETLPMWDAWFLSKAK